jgi:hypothetical protein
MLKEYPNKGSFEAYDKQAKKSIDNDNPKLNKAIS